VKRSFKEVLRLGKQKRVNANQLTFAEILLSAFVGSEATNNDISSLLELDKQSCRESFEQVIPVQIFRAFLT
jgi:hypothetical protein